MLFLYSFQKKRIAKFIYCVVSIQKALDRVGDYKGSKTCRRNRLSIGVGLPYLALFLKVSFLCFCISYEDSLSNK